MEVAEKTRLHKSLGAVGVDTESHIAAFFAKLHGLPFVVVRAVADDARCNLLKIALAGRRPDGSVSVGNVLAGLRERPSDLGPLMQLAAKTNSARAALVRLRPVLARDFRGLSAKAARRGAA
jgi:hypothetical protein